MDTPERSKVGGAPLSKFEDSPIFNFINNLSPIQPVKSAHGAQVFHSLSFASISSVFSSPQINLQKESKDLIRPPDSDLSKLDTSDNLDQSNLCSEISASAQENNTVCLLNQATVDPPEECSTENDELPHSVQYDCGSPDHKTGPCYGVKLELKLDSGQSQVEVAQFVRDGLENKKVLFATEIDLQEEHQLSQNTEEVVESGWENLISEDTEDLLVFDSPTNSDDCKEQAEKFGSSGANSVLCSSPKPEDVTEISENSVDFSLGPCFQNTAQYPPTENNEEVGEQQGRGHTPQIFSGTCHDQVAPDDQKQETRSGPGFCITIDSKVESQQQRGMRRRCLTFESAGTAERSNNKSMLHSSVALPSGRKLTSEAKKSFTLKPGSSLSSCILPSIGLHLNALATTPKDRFMNKDALPFGKRVFSTSCSTSPFPLITVGQKLLNKSMDVENNLCPTNNEVLKLEIMHDDASEPSEFGVGENSSQSSPKKKKRKSENGGENEACKRCNCKKSKCLKLYCECFAAGVYCVEPCSCQGCFNKPAHEETVLATRKQIESRNPLAFAPKVIRASDPVEEMGEETNKTPASARHKRGCNCKKSGCLKKYCECYQGGVGCSPSCRCEGCKNAFGRKDAEEVEQVEQVEEAMDVCDKQVDKLHEDQLNDTTQKNENHSSDSIPLTPFEICRPSFKLPFHSGGKPPRSSSLSIGYPTSQTLRKCEFPLLHHKLSNRFLAIPEDDTPEILRGAASPNNGVKTVSPNGKRVSPPHNTLGISPHRKGGRKLILKSIPSFPSLNSEISNERPPNYSNSHFSSSALNSDNMN